MSQAPCNLTPTFLYCFERPATHCSLGVRACLLTQPLAAADTVANCCGLCLPTRGSSPLTATPPLLGRRVRLATRDSRLSPRSLATSQKRLPAWALASIRSMACCSTSAFRRRNLTMRRADSALCATVPLTCEWTNRAAHPLPSGLLQPPSTT